VKPRPEVSAKAKREAAATKRRPLHTLPAAWHEPGVAENMKLWLEIQEEAGANVTALDQAS
jgi:hypothetical protein